MRVQIVVLQVVLVPTLLVHFLNKTMISEALFSYLEVEGFGGGQVKNLT